MDRLSEFRIFYNHTIHPELVRMENRRKKLLWLSLISILLFLAIGFVAMYLNIPTVTFFLMIPLGLYLGYLSYRMNEFVKTFKPNVVNLVLDFIDDDLNFDTLRYDGERFIGKKQFKKSKIFTSNASFYKGEDYISGKIGEVPFEMCELKVRELSKVRDRYNYVFRGVFMRATMKRPVRGSILILPAAFKQYLTRTIKSFNRAGGEQVEESFMTPAFGELFDVYVSPDAQPRYVLDEDIQVKIANYREKIGKEIYLSFVNNDIYVAVTEPKDILEPYIFRSNVSFTLVLEFFKDIQLLLGIVQDFDGRSADDTQKLLS